MARSGTHNDVEMSLAIRAAWLHYAAGLTQGDVAVRLGVPKVKAHRLISRANTAGAVKITIEGEIAECAALEAALCERYGLTYCEVAPHLGEDGLPVRALGITGARFLAREIEGAANPLIGLGHGRTLASVVAQLPRIAAGGVRFVSLLGGVTRRFAATPYDVMHRLAEKTGGEAFVLPVPIFANSVADRDVLLAQRGVAEVLELAGRSGLKLVGIGTTEPDAQIVDTGMIERAESEEVKAQGGVGEMLGHFFDKAGHPIETTLTRRAISLGLPELEQSRIVAVAGGPVKTDAIRSVLKSGVLQGLITDERTASALAHDQTNNGRTRRK